MHKKEFDNLVLLCKTHHEQAPNLSISKEIMLKWIEEESEIYDHFFHMKKEDLHKWIIAFTKINTRLADVIGDDCNQQDLISFLMDVYGKHSIIVGSHQQANIRTRTMFFEYMAEYKDLEIDYLKYLLKKDKCNCKCKK